MEFKNLKIKKFDIKILVVFFIFLILIASRRWQQLIEPSIWVEDGTIILPELLLDGLLSFFKPSNSYLTTSSKIISYISLLFGLENYALVSSYISLFFSTLVVMAVWLSPTKLSYKLFSALLVIFIPTNSEVFGTPLYSFWWASLLLFLAVLWDNNTINFNWRLFYIILGGLSSPLSVILFPLFLFRSWKNRQKTIEIVHGIVAFVIALIQAYFIISEQAKFSSLNIKDILLFTIPKYLGSYSLQHFITSEFHQKTELIILWSSGLITLVTLIFSIKKEKYLIVLLLIIAVTTSCLRVNPGIVHSALAGPRYFFSLSYYFLGLLLIVWIMKGNLCQVF